MRRDVSDKVLEVGDMGRYTRTNKDKLLVW